MQIVVVGGGMQGRVIAENLLARPEKPEVVVVDLKQPDSLPAGARFQKVDVLDQKQAVAAVKGADAVVLAVPSVIAHDALKNLIAAGVPIADVSFTPDPPLSLDIEAKKTGACCVVDVGIAPGLSHMLVGKAKAELGGLDSVRILVGGIPQNPPEVFRHAVYFNPHDLLSEYVRPARARKGGKDIQPHPMDVAPESFKDSALGNLEAFLSDGLRSLLTSFPEIPEMVELTLRWPGHLETMRNLRELGLLDSADALRALGDTIGTRYPAKDYPDALLLVVEAKRGGELRAWRVLDRCTPSQSSMSRTTGFTTAAVAMVLARKQFTEPGVHAPERLGREPNLTEAIINDLAERGVKTTSLIPA
jgi:lysine 6-dehydrogenase